MVCLHTKAGVSVHVYVCVCVWAAPDWLIKCSSKIAFELFCFFFFLLTVVFFLPRHGTVLTHHPPHPGHFASVRAQLLFRLHPRRKWFLELLRNVSQKCYQDHVWTVLTSWFSSLKTGLYYDVLGQIPAKMSFSGLKLMLQFAQNQNKTVLSPDPSKHTNSPFIWNFCSTM